MTNLTMNALINLKGINYSYQMNAHEIPILSDITLTLWRGETCAIYGASGSGKSSLLNILGLLDKPKSGSFHFFDRDILKENLDAFGLVNWWYQFYRVQIEKHRVDLCYL